MISPQSSVPAQSRLLEPLRLAHQGAATRQPATLDRLLDWYVKEHFDLLGHLANIMAGSRHACRYRP